MDQMEMEQSDSPATTLNTTNRSRSLSSPGPLPEGLPHFSLKALREDNSRSVAQLATHLRYDALSPADVNNVLGKAWDPRKESFASFVRVAADLRLHEFFFVDSDSRFCVAASSYERNQHESELRAQFPDALLEVYWWSPPSHSTARADLRLGSQALKQRSFVFVLRRSSGPYWAQYEHSVRRFLSRFAQQTQFDIYLQATLPFDIACQSIDHHCDAYTTWAELHENLKERFNSSRAFAQLYALYSWPRFKKSSYDATYSLILDDRSITANLPRDLCDLLMQFAFPGDYSIDGNGELDSSCAMTPEEHEYFTRLARHELDQLVADYRRQAASRMTILDPVSTLSNSQNHTVKSLQPAPAFDVRGTSLQTRARSARR